MNRTCLWLVLAAGLCTLRFANAQTPTGSAPDSQAANNDAPAAAAAPAKDALTRSWRDRNGRTVEAAFLGCEAGRLRLQRTRDGRIFEVPLASLSDEDQAFVRAQPPQAAKLRLDVKFTPGSYTLTEVMNTATEITAEGQRQKMGDAMTVGGGVSITAPDASGEQTVRFVCRQIKSEASLPGMTMRFDSQGPEEEQHKLLASVLRPLLGWEGVLTVRDGKFVKVDGVEHLISKIQASLPPEATPLADKLKTQMQDFLKEMLTRHWAQILPHEPVGPGDAWQAKLQVRSIPMLGEMSFDCDCHLDGVEEAAGGKVAVWSFKCKSTVEDRPIDLAGLVPPGVQAKIQRMTVNQTGRARFDTRIGLRVQATLDSQVDGELSVRTPDGQSGIVKLQVTAKYQNTLAPDEGGGAPSSVSAAGPGPGRADRQPPDAEKTLAGQAGPPVRETAPPAVPPESGPPKYCVFEGLKLRKDPNASADETGKLRAGQEVDISEVQASWCRVKTAQAEGWVHKMALADSAELAQRIGALRPQPNALFVLSELKGPGSCGCEILHGGLKLAAPGQELRMAAGNCLAIEKCDYQAPFSIFGKTIEPLRFDTLYWLNGQDELVPVLDAVRATTPESNSNKDTQAPAAIPKKETTQEPSSRESHLGQVTVARTIDAVKGVLELPGASHLGEGPILTVSVKPKEGQAWLLVRFRDREGEFSFELADFSVTIPGQAAPSPAWAASPDGGDHFMFDITKMAPVGQGRVNGKKLAPAFVFEVPSNVRSATLNVESAKVPLQW